MGWIATWIGVLWLTAGASPPHVYDVTHLIQENHLELVGGKRVELPMGWQGTLEFVDLHPRANWTHAARLDWRQDGQVRQSWTLDRPPQGWVENPQPKVDFSLKPGAYPVQDPSRFWAVLINGHASQRHWNDFSFLYRTLTKVYGYDRAHILVADSVFQTREPDLDGDRILDIEYGSTEKELDRLFRELGARMKPGDRLVLAVNDHGNLVNGQSTILLYDAEIFPARLAQWLGSLPKHERITMFGQCNAGGFVRPTLAPQGVGVAAALDIEITWARIVPTFDEFYFHWISALAGQQPDGTPVPSDGNRDGRISLREAFAYTLGADLSPASPFMEASPNSGLERRWTLGD